MLGRKKNRASKPSHASTPVDLTTDVSDEEATDAPQGTGRGDSVESREPGVQVESISRRTVGHITVEGPDRLLEELVDTMKGIKQVLIGAHHSHARSSRRSRFLGTGPEVGGFELMNDTGELPTAKGLPMIGKKGYYFQYDSALTADQLAQYLQFYNIGHDLVDTGDKPTIRKGQRAKAEDLLSNYLN